jgi:hypothetical protein
LHIRTVYILKDLPASPLKRMENSNEQIDRLQFRLIKENECPHGCQANHHVVKAKLLPQGQSKDGRL